MSKITLKTLATWIQEVEDLTQPDSIYWCDGSPDEYQSFISQMLITGDLLELNQTNFPGCYLHRSDPKDVARVEHLTYICSKEEVEAGPNNNWMAPNQAKTMMNDLFQNCMKGRTMYVIPYCMGPLGSKYSRYGVEITDSIYVAANMYLMTRMGTLALREIEAKGSFIKGLHSTGELDPERRFVMHFPEELLIMSYGSGYGGNALLGKKCHALRIASYQARTEGWLAEHMLIVGLENPEGEVSYLAAAFPSACGKTNLAMLIPPEEYNGWKVWTLGDDIAWLHLDDEGQLRAINPEAGYFGVVPGTNLKTNPNAYNMITKDTIFTNVAITEENDPWWEGKEDGRPTIDWLGNPYIKENHGAHPNSRFTVSAQQNPSYSSLAEAPEGVPISALVFGGKRKELAPLVYEARDWQHGVMVAASMASETTAAATGKVGVVRRDPMAMKPFCGYNYGDYWSHWLSFGEKSTKLPKIFHVNWFRQNNEGEFLWPGFGENMRVLEWIINRSKGSVEANDTAIGFTPKAGTINLNGLSIDEDRIEELSKINHAQWSVELIEFKKYLNSFEGRTPKALVDECTAVLERLG
jgi:phosphoenolpyruvate carboxykinase (GTP)